MLQHLLSFLADHWHTLLSAVIVLQAGSVALAVLSERREPAATIAWLMTVTFLPLVGIVAYYALARTRFRRQFRARAAVNRQADEVLTMYLEQHLADFDESVLRSVRPPQQALIELGANSAQFRGAGHPFPGNNVRLFFDADAKYESLKEAIRSAQSHIHLGYYIFNADGTGTEIRNLLAERAAAGVEVRVLVDGVGSLRACRSGFFQPLARAGGEVAVFQPPRFGRIIARVNFRNHRKIAVVDGALGFVGGMNIGDEYRGLDPDTGRWRDAHLRIQGPVVAALQQIFLTDWMFTTGRQTADATYFPDIDHGGEALVQIVASGPDCRWPTIQQLYLQALTAAEEEILIATPYFVPDRSMVTALQTAALRGVDVRVMLPRKSNVRIVTSAARSYYEELLEAGVRIFELTDGFLHSKTLAVDRRYGSVGSANMDVRSFLLNFEVSAFVYNEAFARALREQFEADITVCEEINLDRFRRRPRIVKLAQSVAQLLSGIL